MGGFSVERKGRRMKGFRYLTKVATLQLAVERCTGCRRCVEVCPHGVFTIADGKAQIIDHDACIECGACARNCSAAAIAVDAGVGCASGMINEWLQDMKLRRLGGGC
jgi:NAD-dependent dihydropyrimidine dehydrogenase PreA subunit